MNRDLIYKKQVIGLLGREEEERPFPIDELASAKALMARKGLAYWRNGKVASIIGA